MRRYVALIYDDKRLAGDRCMNPVDFIWAGHENVRAPDRKIIQRCVAEVCLEEVAVTILEDFGSPTDF